MTDFVTVEAKALTKALQIVNSVTEARNTIPILGCVKLSYSKEGLKLTGTNLDMEIALFVDEIDGAGEWEVCIVAPYLRSIAAAAGVASMRIEIGTRTVAGYQTASKSVPERQEDFATITVGHGEAVYEIHNTLPASDWPEMQKQRGDLIERFTNGMLAASLDKVAWAISTEETRYYLNGVAMQRNANGRRFAATDGHRLALCRYDSEPSNAVESRIIPRRAVAFITRHFRNSDVEIFATDDVNVVDFVAPGMTFRSRLIDGTFPDIDRVVPKSQAINYAVEFKRDEIVQAIRQATAVGRVGKSDGMAIRFHGLDGLLHIERKNVEFGTSKVRTSSEWPEEGEAIGFNSRYLAEMISRCQGTVKMGMTGSGAPALLADDDETMTRVVMPMRV